MLSLEEPRFGVQETFVLLFRGACEFTVISQNEKFKLKKNTARNVGQVLVSLLHP